MDFSTAEKRIIERVRKEERDRVVMRCLSLVGGLAMIGAWALALRFTIQYAYLTKWDEQAQMAVALVGVIALFSSTHAIRMVYFGIKYWHGKPKNILLLKLFDHINSKT